ncbi:hypothetical protein [Rhodococcus koreensis]|uniref:hypothetical protein n=1 Tax=Rhodococcus koreensis TaxID=99653 RepID=UPI0036DE6460
MPDQEFIKVDDLRPYLKGLSDEEIRGWIDDAIALAETYAPCIVKPSFAHGAALKALLRSAIRYSVGASDGAVTQVSGGPWQKSVDTRQAQSGVMFSKLQIERLENMCLIRVPLHGAYSVPLGAPEQL